MAIQEALAARLAASAGLAALVSTRIFWGRAPQTVVNPCLVYKKMSGEPVHAMGSDTGLQLTRWLFVALGDTRASAEAVMIQVKAQINRLHDTTVAGTFIDSIFLDDAQDTDLDDDTLTEAVARVYRVNYRE